MAFLLVEAEACKQRNGIYEYDYSKVVCDLDMVGLDLHAQSHRKQHRTKNGFRKP